MIQFFMSLDTDLQAYHPANSNRLDSFLKEKAFKIPSAFTVARG